MLFSPLILLLIFHGNIFALHYFHFAFIFDITLLLDYLLAILLAAIFDRH